MISKKTNLDYLSLAKKLRFFSLRKICLVNKKNKKVIVNNLFGASSFFELANGLMFRKLPEDSALLFFLSSFRKVSLHMFFVFYSIDVLYGELSYIDDDYSFKVVDLKSDFKPFSLTSSNNLVNAFIELPSGTISKNLIGVNDIILFEEQKPNFQ